jgi:hypothetical protein
LIFMEPVKCFSLREFKQSSIFGSLCTSPLLHWDGGVSSFSITN